MLISNKDDLITFELFDPPVNLSDHLPLKATLKCQFSLSKSEADASKPHCVQLRWDKADLNAYYYYTGACAMPLLQYFNDMLMRGESVSCDINYEHLINEVHDTLVTFLNDGANLYVPSRVKEFYKF